MLAEQTPFNMTKPQCAALDHGISYGGFCMDADDKHDLKQRRLGAINLSFTSPDFAHG
jgi:hypothetical protein